MAMDFSTIRFTDGYLYILPGFGHHFTGTGTGVGAGVGIGTGTDTGHPIIVRHITGHRTTGQSRSTLLKDRDVQRQDLSNPLKGPAGQPQDQNSLQQDQVNR